MLPFRENLSSTGTIYEHIGTIAHIFFYFLPTFADVYYLKISEITHYFLYGLLKFRYFSDQRFFHISALQIMVFQYILLIDDEMSVNYFHEYLIEDMRLCNKILKARNAEEGRTHLRKLGQIEKLAPSLIFLDINMPQYNGFEFIDLNAELLEKLCQRGLHILILTTSNNPTDIETAQRYDLISGYEQKPMTFNMLGAAG